jgi:hypothetical protein
MRFFFPDSQDQIDPSFDFERESSSPDRVRQRDDRYAHEVISPPPYSGILLSKALIDGPGRYTFAQRHRLFRLGVREFFRLDDVSESRMETMGDCGAFNYVHEDVPPYSVDEVFDFYEECGFDYGISVDHIILAYLADSTVEPLEEWQSRQDLTLEYAAQFFRRHRREKPRFVPLGVAQGWDPASYAEAVRGLQRIGFRYIALGGMVPLKTNQILACLEAIARVRRPDTQLHLLGITRTERANDFSRYGVVSLDSTSPFRQSFKDDRDNYHTLERNFVAIRVMQIDGNLRLKRRILAGELDQNEGRRLELACLSGLAAYDRGKTSLEGALDALDAYQDFLGESRRRGEYEVTLATQPWKSCPCEICADAGIQVVIFRGAERNKRRGFHNLHVFNRRLQAELATVA